MAYVYGGGKSRRKELGHWMISRGRYQKRALLIANDIVLLSAVLWLAVSLVQGTLFVPRLTWDWHVWLMTLAPVATVVTISQLGLYRIVVRYIGAVGAVRLALAVLLSSVLWGLAMLAAGDADIPLRSIVLYALLGAMAICSSRIVASVLLQGAGTTQGRRSDAVRTAVIYGAGRGGVELLRAVRASDSYALVGFVDTNPNLWGRYVDGLKVYRPERLGDLIDREQVEDILLALPDASREQRLQVLGMLGQRPVRVRTLPRFAAATGPAAAIGMLRDVGADELLGRMPIAPDAQLLARNTTGKSILITGAGGSIGSELARQIVRLGPRRLVLLDIAETPLYELESELYDACLKSEGWPVPEIVTLLGSILDDALVLRTMTTHGIETIYHAAAYKHVPLVEANGIVGLRNNVFGTIVLAEAAVRCNVECFVLVSTDKAVHPASLMGASKRLAEMVMQARAIDHAGPTVFTVVRFGNVLDSSGSVVRRFRRQIETGGPVTVTHPDMVRYFMSIPEAASLVIQAGAMATGGEVFILDMGEPVRIDELARAMITIMGLQVRDAHAPDGDIAIDYIGLRPGEKLTEELLLGKDVTGTEHPRILKCAEPYVPPARLDRELAIVDAATRAGDMTTVGAVLARVVEGYGQGIGLEPVLDESDTPLSAAVGH